MKKHLDIKATGERSLTRLEKDQLVIPESLEASDSFLKKIFFSRNCSALLLGIQLYFQLMTLKSFTSSR